MTKITLLGLKYLDENSKWSKAYRIAKEVKALIRL
ncbi:YjcQ family protein [Saccharococcus caldoxylosilyticus]